MCTLYVIQVVKQEREDTEFTCLPAIFPSAQTAWSTVRDFLDERRCNKCGTAPAYVRRSETQNAMEIIHRVKYK